MPMWCGPDIEVAIIACPVVLLVLYGALRAFRARSRSGEDRITAWRLPPAATQSEEPREGA